MTDHAEKLKEIVEKCGWRDDGGQACSYSGDERLLFPTMMRIATAQQAELVRLREALSRALPYVESQSEAEHMLDGFGPRRERPSDVVLRIVRAALTTGATHER